MSLMVEQRCSKISNRKEHNVVLLIAGADSEAQVLELKKKSENGTQTILNRKTRSLNFVKEIIPNTKFFRKRGKTRSLNFVKEIIPNTKFFRKRANFMSWQRFHRLGTIYSFLEALEREFPSICTVYVIGKSVEGRDIKLLKVSNSDARNSPVWIDACIHPREWITTSVVTYIADCLVRGFAAHPHSITNKDWYIVPVLNPDGYEYTHTHDRMWRKNRARHGGACVGVDLNRNFSYGWANNGDEGSSNEPTNVFYRGPTPFSEPETIAVRDTILTSPKPFKVFLSFHSYFELIIFPWGHKNDPCPDYIRLLEGGTRMARAIYETTNYTYRVGSTKDMTYFACGTSTDWSYGVAKIPFSYMIELRSKRYKFRLPRCQILDTATENWQAVRSLMAFVDED